MFFPGKENVNTDGTKKLKTVVIRLSVWGLQNNIVFTMNRAGLRPEDN